MPEDRGGIALTPALRDDDLANLAAKALEIWIESVTDRYATDDSGPSECKQDCGRHIVARQIHELSRRRKGPFVAVNCAAIVETLLEAELFGIEERTATGVRGRRGKFEHAHEGTLFLDEVSDLSPAAQAKLLRAIQDLSVERVGGFGTRRVDTRIIVATNVRELERVIERAVALAGSDWLELDDLPPAQLGGYADVLLPLMRSRESMRAWGSRYAWLVYERCGNNKRQACRELGISYDSNGTRGEGKAEERDGANNARTCLPQEPTRNRSSRKGPLFGRHRQTPFRERRGKESALQPADKSRVKRSK